MKIRVNGKTLIIVFDDQEDTLIIRVNDEEVRLRGVQVAQALHVLFNAYEKTRETYYKLLAGETVIEKKTETTTYI